MTNEYDRYLQIKADIEQAYKQTVRTHRRQRQASKSHRLETRFFWFAMMAPSCLAVLLTIVGKTIDAYWLFNVSWILIGVSYLALFLFPLLGIALYRHSLKKIFISPFASLLDWNVKTVMHIDAQYLPQLTALSRDTLKLGALELKSERNSFEKRTYMVTGALEKIGIFHGALALIIGVTAAIKALDSAGISARMDWMFALAVANLFFFFMCCVVQMMLVHYDRMIALTELAIERKKEHEDAGKGIAGL
jgi:hypothetical protein